MSPKSIKAFMSYYAVNVVGVHFDVPKTLVDTAIVLTQQVAYRRIAEVVLRYDKPKLRERDVVWRSKCNYIRYADPIALGAPEEYVYGFKRKKQMSEEEVQQLIAECTLREEEAARASLATEAASYGQSFYAPFKAHTRIQMLLRARAATAAKLQRGAPVYGTPYARTSQVFSWLSSTVVPHEMCSILLLAQKWLLKDAIAVSGRTDYLGADQSFPITGMCGFFSERGGDAAHATHTYPTPPPATQYWPSPKRASPTCTNCCTLSSSSRTSRPAAPSATTSRACKAV